MNREAMVVTRYDKLNKLFIFTMKRLFKKIINIYLIIFLIICALISFLVFTESTIVKNPISSSPDETGDSVFIAKWAKDENLIIENYNSWNKNYNNVFSPRGAVVNDKGQIVPLKAIGDYIFFGFLYKPFINLINVQAFLTLFKILYIVLIAILFYYFFNYKKDKQSLIILALLLVLPECQILLSPYSISFVASLLFLRKWYMSGKNEINFNLISSSLTLALTLFFRYEYYVLSIPIFIWLLFKSIKLKKVKIFIAYLVAPLLTLILFLLSNKLLYGNYLTLGYILDNKSSDVFSSQTTLSIAKLSQLFVAYGFHPISIIENISRFVLIMYGFLFLPFLIKTIKEKKFDDLGIITLLSFCYLVIYYGSNNNFYGNGTFDYDSSYVRYFSPLILFTLPKAIEYYRDLLVNTFSKNKILCLLLISLFIVFSIFRWSENFNSLNLIKSNYSLTLNEAATIFPKNAVLFTNYWDKVLYPTYIVATQSKKVGDINSFYKTAINFKNDNINTPVFFIPIDMNEKNQFNLFINKQTNISCKQNSFLHSCELEYK